MARRERQGASGKRPQAWLRRLHAGFRHHQQVAVDSLERLLLSPGSSLLTWFVIAIALALPLCLLLLVQNLQQFGSELDAASRLSLFLEQNLEEQRLEEFHSDIESHEGVVSTQFISSAAALEEFRELSGFGDVLSGLDANPLPPVIVVNPRSQDAGELQALVAEFEAMAGVDHVQFDLAWIQRLYSILDLARVLATLFGGLLCVGVALVVGNTVRLAIENRRDEILVVKLVGGTDAYVARPFLYTGFWYGVGGGLIACVLLLLAQWALQGPVSRLAGMYDGSFELLGLRLSDVLLVVLGSGLLGWVGAWLSVVRHLKAIEPR